MRKVLLALFFSVVILTACAAKQTQPSDSNLEFVSTTTKEECHLCNTGVNADIEMYRGQDNVGLINLNTFEVQCVEINRYDRNGQLIEEATGVFRFSGFTFGETRVQNNLDVDRGYASISIPLENDKGIDPEAVGGFLCEECLYDFSSQSAHEEEASELAAINFDTMEIRTLEPRCPWFTFGSYMVTCEFDDYNNVDLLVIYRPVRYHEAADDPSGANHEASMSE